MVSPNCKTMGKMTVYRNTLSKTLVIKSPVRYLCTGHSAAGPIITHSYWLRGRRYTTELRAILAS